MHIARLSTGAIAGALTVCLSIAVWTGASMAAPATVTSTQGTVVVMRGNSVTKLAAGDLLRNGDRVIATGGGSATLSGGAKVGSSSLAVTNKNEIKIVSKTTGSSPSKNSGGSKSSNLFWDSHDGDDDDDRGHRERDDHHDRDGGGHDDSHPWHGDPKDPNPCTSY